MELFRAATRGKKWGVVAHLTDNGTVRVVWTKHGEQQCVQVGLDEEAARDSIAQTIYTERLLDKINYIVHYDDLGVKELIREQA